MAKEGLKQVPWAFPAFSYSREDQCVLKSDTCSVSSTAIVLFGTHLGATGPGPPGFEEELVQGKKLKLQYLILLVAEMMNEKQSKGSPKIVHLKKTS